ncbi:hypothetical protein SEA_CHISANAKITSUNE_2 [Gordonia phage ChisanaKitsune]|uniref:Uncharacterized protein n=1 Tax=Gordonia phage ChisanaKitsune TaxID=2871538 RepID=A0AAE7XEZ4_9CAUD|nr:hypothetical protein PQD15_gp002 [Gordonia phage ChisanaKitsune]QZE10776.1 hypothetical protein SEA_CHISANAKITSUNE_2 [Gordonia phage ChisanaKitsune]
MFGISKEALDPIKEQIRRLTNRVANTEKDFSLLSREHAELAVFKSAAIADLNALREAHTSLADHVNKQLTTMAQGHVKDFDNLRSVVQENVGRQFPIDMRRLCLELASRMDDMESIDDVVTRAAYLERLIIHGFDAPAPDDEPVEREEEPASPRHASERMNDPDELVLDSVHDHKGDGTAIIGWRWKHRPSGMTTGVLKDFAGAETEAAKENLVMRVANWKNLVEFTKDFQAEDEDRHEYVDSFGSCAVCGRSEIVPVHRVTKEDDQ